MEDLIVISECYNYVKHDSSIPSLNPFTSSVHTDFHWLFFYFEAKVLSHSTSTTLYSSMVALASSTDECPFFPVWEHKGNSLLLQNNISYTIRGLLAYYFCRDKKEQPRLNHCRLYSNQSHFNQKSLLTWMLRLNRALVSLFSEATSFSGKPAFWLRRGMRDVSRVKTAGWL